jgi:hypothetical protein
MIWKKGTGANALSNTTQDKKTKGICKKENIPNNFSSLFLEECAALLAHYDA